MTVDRALVPLRVASVAHLTRDAIAVTFAVPPEARERFRFVPGQFLTLEAQIAGERVRRSYSICSLSPGDDLRVGIKRVAGGVFSTWAHVALVPGATILAAPPDGRFGSAADAVAPAHSLYIAAGSGITPILAIVGNVLATQARSRVTLIYGNRASSSMMFREELLALKDRYLARLSLVFVMSREPQEIATFAGRIDRAKCDALFARWVDIASVDRAYVCGPAEMMVHVVESLAAHGLTGNRVRIERFAATKSGAGDARRTERVDATVSNEKICDARATMDGRTFVFPIRRGTETVLDAGLRAGIELPYACKGGVCATCRAVLIDGEVDMDVHYALEDYEIARGFVLLCQSYPASATLAVDLDANATA